jgi:hypothetical protein
MVMKNKKGNFISMMAQYKKALVAWSSARDRVIQRLTCLVWGSCEQHYFHIISG